MSSFSFGIDKLLQNTSALQGKRVGLVAHPASVTGSGAHSLDALVEHGLNISRAFGPQHGLRGDKQDNMIESEDFVDPKHKIPVISLYGQYRYPQPDMLEDLDVVLFDLQDVGCRVYTYITTLRYFISACADKGVELWILDRPNPAGRPVDGLYLEDGEQSFVGCDILPMRHGLTVAELALWFADQLDCTPPVVVPMREYDPTLGPGFGWPAFHMPWINPSPNASSVNMARCFSGTVLLEGTTLSEGRGTTCALELIGAPDLPVEAILQQMGDDWGALLRPCYFTPTFHKHADALCAGIQLHTDYANYDHENFKPFRLIANLLKCLRNIAPDYGLWRHHDYEYEADRNPIDVINGGTFLREWVDSDNMGPELLDESLSATRTDWLGKREPYLLY